jgi:hypothetical protein
MGGSDADTTAAITGAISGACNGAGAIPVRWREKAERGPEIEALALLRLIPTPKLNDQRVVLAHLLRLQVSLWFVVLHQEIGQICRRHIASVNSLLHCGPLPFCATRRARMASRCAAFPLPAYVSPRHRCSFLPSPPRRTPEHRRSEDQCQDR